MASGRPVVTNGDESPVGLVTSEVRAAAATMQTHQIECASRSIVFKRSA